MAAPWGKEVASLDGRSSKLVKESSPSAPLADVPTGLLISFDDDVTPTPPRRNKSHRKRSNMECEPSKSDQGALLSFSDPELTARESPGVVAVTADTAAASVSGEVKSSVTIAATADKSSCETAPVMEEDFSKEGNTNTCRSELRHSSTGSCSEVSGF